MFTFVKPCAFLLKAEFSIPYLYRITFVKKYARTQYYVKNKTGQHTQCYPVGFQYDMSCLLLTGRYGLSYLRELV